MKLLTSQERDELLDTFERDAFHIELRDNYHVTDEDDAFARWRRGEPDTGNVAFERWLRRVRDATRAGKTVRRVRVVTEPVTDYIRWEHHVTVHNQAAGENVRWLPRHQVPADVEFPVGGDDWWMFDDRVLAVGRFDGNGRPAGSELVTDPDVVAACGALRARLWPLAVPHDAYTPPQ